MIVDMALRSFGGAFRAPCVRRLVSADVRHLVRRSSLRRHPRCSPSNESSLDDGDRDKAALKELLSRETKRLEALESELRALREKLKDDEVGGRELVHGWKVNS